MFDSAVGPGLAAQIAAADPSSLSDAELVHLTCAAQRLEAWLASRGLAAAAEFTTRRPAEPDDDDGPGGCSPYAVDELAAALSATSTLAYRQCHHGLLLTRHLPATRALLEQGLITAYKASLVIDQAMFIDDPATMTALDARLASRLVGRTTTQIRRAAQRALHAVDPAAAIRRRRRAHTDRGVWFTPQPETGMTQLNAQLPAAQASRLELRLRALAEAAKTPGDTRTLAQRMADVLVDLALLNPHTRQPAPAAPTDRETTTGDPGTTTDRETTTGDPGTTTGDPASSSDGDLAHGAGLGVPGTGCQHTVDTPIVIHVTAPAATLLGADHQPGELAGYGTIDAALARRLAQDPDATWRRILTDPKSGAVLDVGHSTYRPPAALHRHVRTRDRNCRFPGCLRDAARCQQDHTIPYAAGGPTAAHNLGELCTHHHRLKHHADWQLTQPAAGTFEWTTPTGHTYTVKAND